MSRNLSTFKKDGVPLKKSLGQNILTDKNIIKKIIDSVDIKKSETILEIGPGLGAITTELVKKSNKVVCVEKDAKMVSALKEKISDLNIINEDALVFLKKNPLKKYKVVANIPYYITSSLIRSLLESDNKPTDIFLMIQKEVGKRICASKGDMSVLSVSVNYYAKPKILFTVSKNSFYPRPKVDSVFIRITPNEKPRNNKFFGLVKEGFSHPRKQLANNLKDKELVREWLSKNNLPLGERAENLSVEQWEDLFNLMRKD
ncbi:MAG: 16S rRNA (adenine(1518)-N(6)/adenine(1519)-N(6))-dimethyltransferase RsmA [Candidatus Paceibacterota bacterium]|jgi:16S rRNA (adenine1518-N6/adenine1519-N6)-dimethyltransferase